MANTAYETILDSVLLHYSLSLSTFFDPVTMYGFDMVPGIRVPENAINDTEPDAIIAMGIEVKPPFHDEGEEYSEDFIPAYFPSGEEEECSLETVVGYNDAYDDYEIFPLDEQLNEATHTIVVVTQVPVDGSGNISNKFEFLPTTKSSNIQDPGIYFCEAAHNLETQSAKFTVRWQNNGTSRIRSKYGFITNLNHYNDIDSKKKVMDLEKSYFSSPSFLSTGFNDIAELRGRSFVSPYLQYEEDAFQQYGAIVVYEHDWYGWLVHDNVPVSFGGPNGSGILLKDISMKSPWNYYCHAKFDPFYWCKDNFKNAGFYNNSSEVIFVGE